MKTVVNLGDKFKDRIAARYPPLNGSDLPDNPQACPIEHRNEELENYHVLFWHRLLKGIYGEPAEVEFELSPASEKELPSGTLVVRRTGKEGPWQASELAEDLLLKLERGEVKPGIPIRWRYYVALPTGGVVSMGTKDRNTAFHLACISETADTTGNQKTEIEKFVAVLLEEANRTKEQLFNPTTEFQRKSRLKLYAVNNVYLANYSSGKQMLSIAESEESALTFEWLKYDPRTDDRFDEQKKRTAEQLEMTRGMFYFSAISYFFMALEGFVNLIFHAFLKKDLRDRDLNLDQRLDLEQKLRLMVSLCGGFYEDAQLSSIINAKFRKLKKYRNSLFHSKIEDSLKRLVFVEDGFFYQYSTDFDDRKERFLPFDKGLLTVNHVNEAKTVVDEIVKGILESMSHDTRTLAEKYILNDTAVLFFMSESGDLSMTTEGKGIPHNE